MLVAAAVVPHPPLLVPGTAGAADPLADVRERAVAAVRDLLDAAPDVLALVGSGTTTRRHVPDAAGTLRPLGVDVAVGGTGVPVLPLSLVVARWLLAAAGGPAGPLLLQEVAAGDPAGWSSTGRALAAAAPRVALLVAGDGSARTEERAPGWLDPRAAAWDERCAQALATGDPSALTALEPDLGAALLTAGLPAWHVLGAAAAGAAWDAALLARSAPFGVSYLVAGWVRRAAP